MCAVLVALLVFFMWWRIQRNKEEFQEKLAEEDLADIRESVMFYDEEGAGNSHPLSLTVYRRTRRRRLTVYVRLSSTVFLAEIRTAYSSEVSRLSVLEGALRSAQSISHSSSPPGCRTLVRVVADTARAHLHILHRSERNCEGKEAAIFSG
jgi:hypothetical protein